jgi:hypothetical protein
MNFKLQKNINSKGLIARQFSKKASRKVKDQIPKSEELKQLKNTHLDVLLNPAPFNVTNELYVIAGKERAVGLWLAYVSGTIFGMVVLGGYTRLTKSGLSLVRWEPHRILPPTSV